jgi:hypothetical protein
LEYRNFIGGLTEGVNFPSKKRPFIDLTGCSDIILIDRKYFLENKKLVEDWASNIQETLVN